jgi:hypothetical protein
MKTQLATLAFYAKHNENWLTFHKSMSKTIKKLEAKGFLRVDWPLLMATFTGKTSNN